MTELIVLVDEDGAPLGTAPKASSHHDRTPLHLAFSATSSTRRAGSC